MEQQRATGLAEWQIAKLIENDQIRIHQSKCHVSGFTGLLLQLQRINEFNGGEEAYTPMLAFDGVRADCGGQMRLAGARTPDQYDVMRRVEELTPVQLPDQCFIGGTATKVKAA